MLQDKTLCSLRLHVGSLIKTITCAGHKSLDILLSVLWNGNALLPQQWLAGMLVLVTVGLAMIMLTKGKR